MLCIGLPPSVDAQCTTLVLGSMPGVRSLEEQQYYAHPRNRFWPLMAMLFGEKLPVAYKARLAMLHRHHVGLWDTIGQCEREGSLDSAIHDERPNDIAALLEQYPAISQILCNGGKAHAAFVRYNRALLGRGNLVVWAMPSTSPANARCSLDKLQSLWGPCLQGEGTVR
jgi:TDG/mug DNA glycosylase family protein